MSCAVGWDSSLGTLHSSLLPNRNASQQVLQIIIPPPNARAEREGHVVERVVHAAAKEERGGVLLLGAQNVLAVQPQVRVLVIALGEVEGLAGRGDAIAVVVVD